VKSFRIAALAAAMGIAGCGAPADDADTAANPDAGAVDTGQPDDTGPGGEDIAGEDGTTGPDGTTVDAGGDTGETDTVTPPEDTTTPGGSVVINEVVPSAVDPDVDWIELFNPGTEAADLSGWKLRDDDPLHELLFPEGTVVEAGAYLVLYRDAEGSFDFGLGPDDALFLYDTTTALVDFADWSDGDAPAGASYGRFPNGTGPFETLLTPTPGAANIETAQPVCGNGSIEFGEVCDGASLDSQTCKALGFAGGELTCEDDCSGLDTTGCLLAGEEVVVNEVSATPVAAETDWIELANRGADAVDVGGWTIGDDDPLHVFTIPAGTMIEAGGYLLFTQGEVGSFEFGLGGADSVLLYNGSGELTDTTTWITGQVPASTTWGRVPDATGPFKTLTTPTPGAANIDNIPQECGNGSVELGEVCDGQELGDATCESLGFVGGTLACAGTCDGYDATACTLPASGVVINEVTSSDTDVIELFNSTNGTVDLAGWSVEDDTPDLPDHKYVLPAGTSIGAGGFLVLVKGTDHAFGLGKDDKVVLRDAEGAEVNVADWADGDAAVSYCRVPNGTGAFKPCSIQTFGSANID
jgi:hypothetical protein